MRTLGTRLNTLLATKDLAEYFRQATESLYGLKGRFGSLARSFTQPGGNSFEYFTPRDDSPFSSLEEDKPGFSVGVNIPKFAGTGGGETTVHMYVWDRGSHREVVLVSPHTIGSASSAKKAVSRILTELSQHDSDLQVVDG